MKIFKYKLKPSHNNNCWLATCPKGKVIRTDYVNDGFYCGHFVWMIVDENDKDLQERVIEWIHVEEISHYRYPLIQLGVLEEQSIELSVSSKIKGVADVDGKFWLYYEDKEFSKQYNSVKIVGYKTGQEFRYNPDNLEYLGCCKIWVKQELAVYLFKVK